MVQKHNGRSLVYLYAWAERLPPSQAFFPPGHAFVDLACTVCRVLCSCAVRSHLSSILTTVQKGCVVPGGEEGGGGERDLGDSKQAEKQASFAASSFVGAAGLVLKRDAEPYGSSRW